jgi:D-alanine-D-alanine ligase
LSVPPGQRVAVVFGGPSVEHDVSIITAQQVIAALGERHTPIPLYLARDGSWYTGNRLTSIDAFAADPPEGADPVRLLLGDPESFVQSPAKSRFRPGRDIRVDIVVNAIHGTGGEDGALLGMLDLARVPYVGGGIAASAIAMDKAFVKGTFRAAGIDVLEHELIERSEWESDRDAVRARIAAAIGAPWFVKPASLGSSIGVAYCADEGELNEGLDLALELDRYAVIEPAAQAATELNVAVIGRPGGPHRPSEVEQPVGGAAGLTFEDKYVHSAKTPGGKAGPKAASAPGTKGSGMASQDRILPAPISDGLRRRIQETAVAAHKSLRFAGIVRYDFFAFGTDDEARLVLNEPNTVPGSFASYLFEPAGLSFDALLDELLEIGFAEAREARATTRVFESVLLGLHTGRT